MAALLPVPWATPRLTELAGAGTSNNGQTSDVPENTSLQDGFS